ncbi:hypothetical protein EW145_g5548 [Phellinidium pouzarii]|uniref:Glycoside hydrolase family 78 protein n=1 Tax=Phellinidium pouzarii TaxID=167371 RepID=A0A4S4L4D7_9AGAM|nr:hypothetical protein EW145_g5548 [Phellinidium pouzarii]
MLASYLAISKLLVLFLACCGLTSASVLSGPWDAFSYATDSRTVRPTSVFKTEGSVLNAIGLISPAGEATLQSNGSWVVLDFEKEVGGLISMDISPSSNASAFSLSFTESSMFISPFTSDDSSASSANESYDGVLRVPAPLPNGFWTQPADRLRGGFRFLTIVSNDDAPITISNVSCFLSFSPHVQNLSDYSGYFSAKDPFFHDEDFLTKIWYAGAYTVQTNVIAVNEGRDPFVQSPGWENNATIGIEGPVIVDGAKRDRDIWPGDMGIAVPTQFVSTNDLLPSRNSLAYIISLTDPTTGALPFCGPPLCDINGTKSDTYHAWTLIGVYNYYLYTGDIDWLQGIWTNYTKALQFLENKAQPSGLINITDTADWARSDRGGVDSEGNALYYQKNIEALASAWSANATALKTAFNKAFWSDERGMYTDNATTTFVPQDANALAVVFNLTTLEQAKSISLGLTKNWNEFGAVAPEAPDTIAPFIGGFELQAHFISGNDARALDLLHREWGYMLYTNLSVQSTLLEGYTANGSLGYRSAIGYNYDSSYTSHAHGWSTGPTSALTFYVLGLQVTSPRGATWALSPHFSGLNAAEGGFTTPLGWFGVSWEVKDNAIISMVVSTPVGTQGTVTIPGIETGLQVDGGTTQHGWPVSVSGGSHTITVLN